MITPMDIHNKEFKKGFRGYSEEDVNAFMAEVASDYELLYRDNRELKDVIEQLREKIRHYEQMESTMNSTLVLAQETAENVKSAARKEAELIVQGAEQEKRAMLEDTTRSLREAQEKYETIRHDIAVFRAKMQSMLSSQMKMVEEMVLADARASVTEESMDPAVAAEPVDLAQEAEEEVLTEEVALPTEDDK